MKKLISKLSILLLVLFVGLSLTACKEDGGADTYSKEVAYGDLSSETYASLGTLSLSEKALYDELRTNAYDYLLDELIKKLVPTNEYSVEKNREELEKIVAKNCYGTNKEDELKEIPAATKATQEEKFADQMYLLGVNIKDSQGNIEIYSDNCLKYFINELAQKEYVRKMLTTSTSKYYYANENQLDENGKEIVDENGKVIKNPYYVSEDAIASAYNSTKNNENKYNVVIINYNTLADARKALASYDVENLTLDNFKQLYKDRYGYKKESDDNFLLTSNELSKYNTTLSTLVKNINDNFEEFDEGKTYKVYQQFNGSVYAVYVISKYELSEKEYEDLTEEEIEDTLKEIIENKLTSSTISSLLFEKLHDSKVVINDYVFDTLYALENDKHTRLEEKDWSNDFVASVDGNKITVREFFNSVEKVLGLSTAMDYFTSKTLLTSEADELKAVRELITSKDLEEIDKQYKETMESFNNDELAASGFPKSIGEDVFKFLYFGSTDEAEIKEYYKSQKAWNYYVSYQSEEYFKLAHEFGKRYAGYTETVEGSEDKKEISGKYFDLSVKHILLTVDYNGDGTPDDPELYMNNLEEADKTLLMDAIAKAMVAIVEEVNYLVKEDMTTMVKALDFVLKNYNSDAPLEHSRDSEGNATETWNKYKSKFNLGLKIEDLGSVNNSTASNYVSEFSVGVQKLYSELKAKSLLNEEYLYGEIVDDKLSDTERETLIKEELIKTNYGYHILASYNSASMTSAKYTAASDNEIQYKNIKIKLNGKDATIENAYSSEVYASINQIKIYEGQLNTDDGITALPVGAKTFISKFYSNFKTKYTNTTFKNILFAYTYYVGEGKLTYKGSSDLTKFLEIQQRQFDSYTTPEVNAISIFADWWTLVLPEVK